MSSSSKITLQSSDGESFEVEEAVALESQTIGLVIENDCADNCIPLPNVTSKILAMVIEYCKRHVDAAKLDEKIFEDDLESWDQAFVKVDQATLFDLINGFGIWGLVRDRVFELGIGVNCVVFRDRVADLRVFYDGLAAAYLNIKSLLDLTCQAVADMIKGKTPEEIRKTFNIKDEFTPEEEEEVRRENQWAFE
ncbi:hypothetical protein ACFX13_002671 [Malus domestica]